MSARGWTYCPAGTTTKLHDEPAETRHARAFARRGVWMEPAEDGMAWVHAHLSAPDAVRIVSRLNATSRAMQKKTSITDSDWRSRNRIRADLAAG